MARIIQLMIILMMIKIEVKSALDFHYTIKYFMSYNKNIQIQFS